MTTSAPAAPNAPEKQSVMAAYPPDVYVRPHVASFGAMEFWRVKEILGEAEKEKDRFKRILDAKIESWMADQQKVKVG